MEKVILLHYPLNCFWCGTIFAFNQNTFNTQGVLLFKVWRVITVRINVCIEKDTYKLHLYKQTIIKSKVHKFNQKKLKSKINHTIIHMVLIHKFYFHVFCGLLSKVLPNKPFSQIQWPENCTQCCILLTYSISWGAFVICAPSKLFISWT